ncbi:MAG: PilZ domain-containing protein [Bradymonadales bacterium]|nr:PilZ domain-containing protein [Bradymonadales bacterium]
MLERRTEGRRKVDIILNVYQDGFPVLARAKNISLGGIRLHRVIPPRCLPYERVDLEFQLPGDPEVLFASGQCVYEAKEGGILGIQFLDMDRRSSRKLRTFIDRPGNRRVIH